MQTFRYDSSIWLCRSRDEVFPFFADAFNLEAITPPWLQFRVVSAMPVGMKAGTEITYRLKVHGIPMRWVSRITAWEPPFRFVDEQIAGPYRKWVHEHRFSEVNGKTLCEDQVEYSVPGGSLINQLIVAPDIRRIFEFRSRRLADFFRIEEHAEASPVQIARNFGPSKTC